MRRTIVSVGIGVGAGGATVGLGATGLTLGEGEDGSADGLGDGVAVAVGVTLGDGAFVGPVLRELLAAGPAHAPIVSATTIRLTSGNERAMASRLQRNWIDSTVRR